MKRIKVKKTSDTVLKESETHSLKKGDMVNFSTYYHDGVVGGTITKDPYYRTGVLRVPIDEVSYRYNEITYLKPTILDRGAPPVEKKSVPKKVVSIESTVDDLPNLASSLKEVKEALKVHKLNVLQHLETIPKDVGINRKDVLRKARDYFKSLDYSVKVVNTQGVRRVIRSTDWKAIH